MWRRSWRNSRASPWRPTASVGAFFRSSSPPLGGTKRRFSWRRFRASCYPCTAPRCSAASTSAAPRPLASPSSCPQGIFGKHEMGRWQVLRQRGPNQEDKIIFGQLGVRWWRATRKRWQHPDSRHPVGNCTLVDPTWTPNSPKEPCRRQ
uniref:Uncharacterized protein n=1 Tax=Arundo donax TaxID=35708 RepID=A0A0A9GC96_ARUDO